MTPWWKKEIFYIGKQVERAIVGYVLRKTCFFNTLEKGALRKKVK
jgi:hypothetical protein